MPFAPLNSPSIGLGLLKSSLMPMGISVKVLYFALQFAKGIGEEFYIKIANGEPATYALVGEWIFSIGLHQVTPEEVAGYIRDVLSPIPKDFAGVSSTDTLADEDFIADVIRARASVEAFLDSSLQEVLASKPKIVGFTSVFQQNVASIALARRIKEAAPDIVILFGGANCEGSMGVELTRQYPWIDAVVSGEGDRIFPELITRLLQGKSIDDLDGVYTRFSLACQSDHGRFPNAPVVRQMDELPYPDYDDYFKQLKIHLPDPRFKIFVPFETSRGCWWGEIKHCTFCGLNGDTMAYRSKSAGRAIEELRFLIDRYPDLAISVVDNILDMGYFKTFIPEIAALHLNLELFYEVKANLTKEQVQLLRNAGITIIQPGIESLSSDVLRIMRKGVKTLQNIQLLKWCKEFGVKPYWNLIWGFPGEPASEYARMAEMIPLLEHLEPPNGFASIRLDRFSPNFDTPGELGFTNVQPYPCYSYIYRLPQEIIRNMAYYFTFEYAEPRNVAAYVQPVVQEARRWQQEFEHSDFFWVDKNDGLLLWDLRTHARRVLTVLQREHRALYMACDHIRTPVQLLQEMREQGMANLDEEKVVGILNGFVDRGVMLCEDGRYLSLAIPLGIYSPAQPIIERLHQAIQRLGASNGDSTVISIESVPEDEVGVYR